MIASLPQDCIAYRFEKALQRHTRFSLRYTEQKHACTWGKSAVKGVCARDESQKWVQMYIFGALVLWLMNLATMWMTQIDGDREVTIGFEMSQTYHAPPKKVHKTNRHHIISIAKNILKYWNMYLNFIINKWLRRLSADCNKSSSYYVTFIRISEFIVFDV